MTDKTKILLTYLAEEAMTTALAEYKYYTANDEIMPVIDMVDSISNVWTANKGTAGAKITKEEVLAKDVNPTGALISDYIKALGRTYVVDNKTKDDITLLREGVTHILSKLSLLGVMAKNIANDTKKYRFVLRGEPEYLLETYLYYAKLGCAADLDHFAYYRVYTDKLVDRPYITSIPLQEDDIANITKIVYWSKYEYGTEDYNIGKWLSIILSELVNTVRKKRLKEKGLLSVEENIKTIPVLEYFTPYVGQIWKFQDFLDEQYEDKVLVLDNVTNTRVGDSSIFQDLEVKSSKIDALVMHIENSDIGMFISSIRYLLKYLPSSTLTLLRVNLEQYRRLNKGNLFDYKTDMNRLLAADTISSFVHDIEIPVFDLPPMDRDAIEVTKLPTLDEILEAYEVAKLNEENVSCTFIPTKEVEIDPEVRDYFGDHNIDDIVKDDESKETGSETTIPSEEETVQGDNTSNTPGETTPEEPIEEEIELPEPNIPDSPRFNPEIVDSENEVVPDPEPELPPKEEPTAPDIPQEPEEPKVPTVTPPTEEKPDVPTETPKEPEVPEVPTDTPTVEEKPEVPTVDPNKPSIEPEVPSDVKPDPDVDPGKEPGSKDTDDEPIISGDEPEWAGENTGGAESPGDNKPNDPETEPSTGGSSTGETNPPQGEGGSSEPEQPKVDKRIDIDGDGILDDPDLEYDISKHAKNGSNVKDKDNDPYTIFV